MTRGCREYVMAVIESSGKADMVWVEMSKGETERQWAMCWVTGAQAINDADTGGPESLFLFM